MDPTLIARWQFGITTVYHFSFVTLTIGLSEEHQSRREPKVRAQSKGGSAAPIKFAMSACAELASRCGARLTMAV